MLFQWQKQFIADNSSVDHLSLLILTFLGTGRREESNGGLFVGVGLLDQKIIGKTLVRE